MRFGPIRTNCRSISVFQPSRVEFLSRTGLVAKFLPVRADLHERMHNYWRKWFGSAEENGLSTQLPNTYLPEKSVGEGGNGKMRDLKGLLPVIINHLVCPGTAYSKIINIIRANVYKGVNIKHDSITSDLVLGKLTRSIGLQANT